MTNNHSSLKKISFIIQAIVFLAIGVFVGTKVMPHSSVKFEPLRAQQSTFKFISPLIGFDVSENQNFPEFTKAKNKILEVIGKEKLQKRLETIGLYARTLDNGHWFGIDENSNFEPASLLKVPIMIAYFKKAETNPNVLKEKIRYDRPGPHTESGLLEKPSTLEKDKDYTVEDLIQTMVIKSDNDAMNILLEHLGLNYLTEVFSDFGIQFPSEKEYVISPKQYAVFFRRLRNATFLNRKFSEEALDILSRVEFQDGIAGGASKGITVAHKFGERGVRNNGALAGVELHDCGIVYNPSNPYLLCIMTRGYDVKELEDIISKISFIASKNLSN